MVNRFVFDGLSSLEYRAIVQTGNTFSGPERDYSEVEIPGRNGTLIVDNKRYKNVPVSYEMFFRDSHRLDMFRNAILAKTGYRRLEDNRHPDEYRMACLTGEFEPEMIGHHSRMGTLMVNFTVKPQRYLKVGERPVEITKSNTEALRNPTGQQALPLIRVYGAGTLGVGAISLTVAAHGRAYLDIDSDVGDCFCGADNLNSYVTMTQHRFPTLDAGTTGVSLGAGISKIIIWPRWWRL